MTLCANSCGARVARDGGRCRSCAGRDRSGGGPTVKRAKECADLGMSKADTARALGVTKQRIGQLANAHGLTFKAGYRWKTEGRVNPPSWEDEA